MHTMYQIPSLFYGVVMAMAPYPAVSYCLGVLSRARYGIGNTTKSHKVQCLTFPPPNQAYYSAFAH